MKERISLLLCMIAVYSLLVSQQCAVADTAKPAGFIPVDTLDEKALASKWSLLCKHALWPTDATIAAHLYKGDVTPEKNTLRNSLSVSLAEAYRPSDEDLKNIIPVTALWGEAESDYLLLRYKTKSGLCVQIEDDGRDTFMMITLSQGVALSEIESFIKDTAEAVFDLSNAVPENRINPKIWTWDIDIGESRTGQLRYGHSPQTKHPEWYTSIPWWSDGQRILFMFGRPGFYEKFVAVKKPSRPEPRKFRSRLHQQNE